MFDHLHFRMVMKEAKTKPAAGAAKKKAPPLTLQKPKAIVPANKTNWFESSYVTGSQKEQDRLLFSAPEVT